jgi:hypothetical protein
MFESQSSVDAAINLRSQIAVLNVELRVWLGRVALSGTPLPKNFQFSKN